MSQMTTLTGPERRRRWSDEEQRRIVAEAFLPGAVVSAVARRFDVSMSLIYKWRRAWAMAPTDRFAPVLLVEENTKPAGLEVPAIVVELPGGGRVSIGSVAPASLVVAILQALR